MTEWKTYPKKKGYPTGVSFRASHKQNPWRAWARVGGRRITIGHFRTAEQARDAYLEFKDKVWAFVQGIVDGKGREAVLDIPRPVPIAKHGTKTQYANRKCRCDKCKEWSHKKYIERITKMTDNKSHRDIYHAVSSNIRKRKVTADSIVNYIETAILAKADAMEGKG